MRKSEFEILNAKLDKIMAALVIVHGECNFNLILNKRDGEAFAKDIENTFGQIVDLYDKIGKFDDEKE